MMNKIRFGLIGCSNIAKKHAASLRRIDSAELVAVCDIERAKAQALSAEYAVPYYTDYPRMLESESIDVVAVLTPSGDHAARVLDLVGFGKHIVVEKPMALRLEDADAMIRSCDAAGIKLFVVKQNRYNRPIQALRKALDAGRLGKLVLGTVRVRWCRTQAYYNSAPWRGTWTWDGGVLTNQASHHIDMLEWMMGEVESVTSMITTRLVNIEAEDTAAALLRFRSGALGIIEATTATRPKDLESGAKLGALALGAITRRKFTTPAPVVHLTMR